MPPPVTARGLGLLRLFSMKFTVISNTNIMRLLSGLLEPALAWIATRKLFIFHKAMVPTATS